MTISEIIERLEARYGTQRRPQLDAVSELVLTILSQNTSDANSRPAFEKLIAVFPSWEQVLRADTQTIAETIRAAGLENIKSVRIQKVLAQIMALRGSLDLTFLKDMPLEEAKKWLRNLPGVGPKTAACVLLFSLGMPALPVDTHVYRVARRLGLVSSTTSVESAHEVLESQLKPKDVLRFHMLMIEHGRHLCSARKPRCAECPLLPGCPFGQSLTFGGHPHAPAS